MASYMPGPIPPFRTLHSVGSTTFTPPPLDASMTLPEMLDHHRRNSGNHTFYRFEGDDGSLKTLTWGEVVKGAHKVARQVQAIVKDAGMSTSATEKPVFSILAGVDTITYITTLLGVLRAGFVGFPISSRNSPAAVAHLLSKTKSQFIFGTTDVPTKSLIEAGLAALEEAHGADVPKPQILATPMFEDLYPATEDGTFEYLEDMPAQVLDSPLLILHSSGSTAFPKPIIQTNRNFIEHCRHPYYNGVDYGTDIWAAHGLPPFHAVGIITFTWAISTGMQIGVFRPSFPPAIPTPQKVFDGITAVQANRAFVVPTFLETWSKDEANVEVLSKLRGIIYSGGPMNKAIGDELTAKGVSIRPAYGSTETGFMNVVLTSEPMGEDWEYFEFSDHLKPGLLNDGSDAFEMHIVSCPSSTPAVINTTWDDLPAYTTNDLLVRHPTKPHLWKVYGRADDQIMLSTGEKTNPGPIEAILSLDPHIHAAIMFGRGRFQNGVIIEPHPQFQFDPSDEEKLAAFRSAIWKTVEEANAYAPTHSRLFKEMIIVAHPDKPFAFTPKRTPKRSVILRDYDEEIEAAYKSVEESSLSDIRPPQDWSEGETARFVRDVVQAVLEVDAVEDGDDIFNQHGADSLQVTWIRNAVLHALRSAKVSVTAVPQNFVYNYPTVARLARYVARVASASEDDAEKSDVEYKIEELEEMVAKYTQDFTAHTPGPAASTPGDVILLTGTTGVLGTNLLAQLVESPEVRRVYAFNRPDRNGATSRDRHVSSFSDRGISLALLDSEKVVFVEGDPARPDLGLSRALFEEIRDTVTHYIHNAWRVDFNVALASFEPSIKGVRNIIDTALASPLPEPPRLVFTSSVATLRNYPGSTAVTESYIAEPSFPVGSGYGESKWTAEKILQIASHKTTIRPVIARIGQLSGGANGAWSPQEWFPSLVKSADVVKCLPSGAAMVSWLPVHAAAAAIIQMRNASDDVFHLVHPRRVTWTSLLTPIAKALSVPIVSYDEWLNSLEDSMKKAPSEMEAAKENPALRLIDFHRNNNPDKIPAGKEAGGLSELSTELAVRAADALTEAKLPQLGDRDALAWVNYWRSTGFLTS